MYEQPTMRPQVRKRFSLSWFVVAIVALQIALLGLSVAITATLPAVTSGLAGAATLLLAGLTVLVLVYNAGVLDATRESAQATRDEAEATREEARATREQTEATKEQAEIARQSLEELRRSRELDAQPVVVRLEVSIRTVGGRAVRDMHVSNFGRGPALNAIYARESFGDRLEFVRTGVFNLASGQAIQIPAEESEDCDERLFASGERPREALICQDQFGNTFHFTPGDPRPDVFSRSGLAQPMEGRPPWVVAFEQLLNLRPPEPQPQPGPNFLHSIHVMASYSECQTSVVWEAVPPSDLSPSDSEIDTIGEHLVALEPRARRESAEIARWAYPPNGSVNEQWWARAYAGPCVSVTSALPLKAGPSASGQGLAADLPLIGLASLWQVGVITSRRLAQALNVRRMRVGLTLVMSGAHDKPRLQDVDFGQLERPIQIAAPGFYVRNFSDMSTAFDTKDWPRGFLESSIREVLRRFGYRDVDAVITSLPFDRPLSDPP